MRQPTELESLYIDFDCFFASAEKQLRPELRGRPVGVKPLDSKHTSIIAACYTSKSFGIKRGTSVQDARSLCPHIVLPVARHDEYVKMHYRILEELDRHVPVAKVWSVDEMECTLMGNERAVAEDLAHQIRKGLKAAIGPWVTPSIGLAPNQFLAKIAAEMNKPMGHTVLRPEDLPGPLFDLDLQDIPGISSSMFTRLGRAGVHSVEDLWNLSPKHARAIWRSVEGERLWAQLRGYAVSRKETVRRMFGHGRVLSRDWRQPKKAYDCIRLLTAKAARRLRREGYSASKLSVGLTTQNNQRWQAEITFAPARDDHTFLSQMTELYWHGVKALRGARLKKLSVMLHGITPTERVVDDLFEQEDKRIKRRRWETITEAMDHLNAKYESHVVSLGPRREPPGGYAGAKIAFGRIPDLNDFH